MDGKVLDDDQNSRGKRRGKYRPRRRCIDTPVKESSGKCVGQGTREHTDCLGKPSRTNVQPIHSRSVFECIPHKGQTTDPTAQDTM